MGPGILEALSETAPAYDVPVVVSFAFENTRSG